MGSTHDRSHRQEVPSGRRAFLQRGGTRLGGLKEPVNAGRYERLDPEARAEVDGKIREIVNDRVRRMKQAEKQQRPARQGKAAR